MGVVKLADYRPQLEVVEHRVADTEDGFMRVANEITDSLLMADLTVRQAEGDARYHAQDIRIQ